MNACISKIIFILIACIEKFDLCWKSNFLVKYYSWDIQFLYCYVILNIFTILQVTIFSMSKNKIKIHFHYEIFVIMWKKIDICFSLCTFYCIILLLYNLNFEFSIIPYISNNERDHSIVASLSAEVFLFIRLWFLMEFDLQVWFGYSPTIYAMKKFAISMIFADQI